MKFNNLTLSFLFILLPLVYQGCGSDKSSFNEVSKLSSDEILFFNSTDGKETVTKIQSDFSVLNVFIYTELNNQIIGHQVKVDLSATTRDKLKDLMNSLSVEAIIPQQNNCANIDSPSLFHMLSNGRGYAISKSVSHTTSISPNEIIKVGLRKNSCDKYYDLRGTKRASLLTLLNKIIDEAVRS